MNYEHRSYCPMAYKPHSSLCVCAEIQAAEVAAEVEAMMDDYGGES